MNLRNKLLAWATRNAVDWSLVGYFCATFVGFGLIALWLIYLIQSAEDFKAQSTTSLERSAVALERIADSRSLECQPTDE